MTTTDNQASVPYHGSAGVTSMSVRAVEVLLQTSTIESARLITGEIGSHGLFLSTHPEGDVVVLPSFASGYGGVGPNGLSRTLAMLHAHDVPVDELRVDAAFFQRLDRSGLSREDLERLAHGPPSPGSRPLERILDRHWNTSNGGASLWHGVSSPMPFGLIEPRLFDLAKSFRTNADASLLTAYRRLEDRVRERIDSDATGAKLMSAAFHGDPARLIWGDIVRGELQGRANRFTSVFMTYRNPRAHKEPKSETQLLMEFLAVNELFMLEAMSVAGPPPEIDSSAKSSSPSSSD